MAIKVFIIVNELLRGGAQRIILDYACAANKNDFELHVVTLKAEDVFPPESKTLLNDLLKTGAHVHSIGGRARFEFDEFKRLLKLFKREKPDIIHTYLPYAGTLGRIAGRLAGVKVIISTQCNLPAAYSFKVYWLDKITLLLAHTWIGATEGIELAYGGGVSSRFSNDLWKQGRRHYTIVAGVDAQHILQAKSAVDRDAKRLSIGIVQNQVLILMTARLISWKGHHEMIRMMEFLPLEYHIAFAGWGPIEDELKTLAVNSGVADRVHFLGAREDIYELLAAADFYIQAFSILKNQSVWVGPNTAMIEAAAAGLPVVASAVPLVEKLIEDGITGKTAEVGNPQAHAQALLWYVQHPSEIPGIVMAAQKRVDDFYTIQAMARQLESLYHVVVQCND